LTGKFVLLLVLFTGVALNAAALLILSMYVRGKRIAEKSRYLDKLARKARISKKKSSIALRRYGSFRREVTKISVVQFLIPFTMYTLSVFVSVLVVGSLTATYGLIQYKSTVCLLPLPVEYRLEGGVCATHVVWIQFFVFLIFSPLYWRATVKALE